MTFTFPGNWTSPEQFRLKQKKKKKKTDSVTNTYLVCGFKYVVCYINTLRKDKMANRHIAEDIFKLTCIEIAAFW